MHKAILAVAAINLGLMAASRIQLPSLATATTQQAIATPTHPPQPPHPSPHLPQQLQRLHPVQLPRLLGLLT